MTQTYSQQERDNWKQMAGEAAAKLVEDGMLIGLGTGSTAQAFIRALGQRIQAGLRIAGAVASSQDSANLAASLDIPLTTLDLNPELDLYVDGTDEIDPQLRLIKGGGGALLREKIVATASKRFVVITDVTKKVEYLGLKAPVPIEVIPFGLTPVSLRLEAAKIGVKLRQHAGETFYTENHNVILDCFYGHELAMPDGTDAWLRDIVGVVETGLFFNIVHQAIIAGPQGIEVKDSPYL
jgi:ribose 5-phosphate isomerase A